MLKTLFTILKLKFYINWNRFISDLKRIPLIGRYIPYSLIKGSNIKPLFMTLAILWKVLTFYCLDLLAFLFTIVIPYAFIGGDINSFLMVVLITNTFFGMIMRHPGIDYDADQYYGIILMRIEAKNYLISNIVIETLKSGLALSIITLVYGLICHINPIIIILYIIMHIAAKTLGAAIGVLLLNHNKISNSIIVIACMVAASGYILAGLRIYIPMYAYITVVLITLIAGIATFVWLLRYNAFQVIYKRAYIKNQNNIQSFKKQINVNKLAASNAITLSTDDSSQKSGYDYFNEIFMKRHKKILSKTSTIICLCMIAILGIIIVLSLLPNENLAKIYSPTQVLCTIPFLLFCLNGGDRITSAMYINCDNGMLGYNFYRQKDTLLGLYKLRAYTILRCNALPAFLLFCIVAYLNLATGKADDIVSLLYFFLTIAALWIFFSLFKLSAYYVLQPYDELGNPKNASYRILHTIVYMICYTTFTSKKYITSYRYFSWICIGLNIILIPLMVFLVYKFAPKNFKRR